MAKILIIEDDDEAIIKSMKKMLGSQVEVTGIQHKDGKVNVDIKIPLVVSEINFDKN